jgi:hypothetical protein
MSLNILLEVPEWLGSDSYSGTPQSFIIKDHLLLDDDVFCLFLQKQKRGVELHIYLEEGTYHTRLFRGPNTNDMKK